MASSPDHDDAAFAELLGELAHAPRLPLVRASGRRSPGERIGPYELRGLLGEGGMGVVYRARDLRLGREVALKLVRPAHVRADIVQRFVREARALASVKSPHVVAIHDLGLEEDVPFLALELLDGAALREQLRAGPLPLEEAVRIVDALLQGLAVVHARGIVHRDLKPENVFLCRNGDVKILDFGLAKLASGHVEEGAGAKTDAGTVLGTAYYMAPEQVKSGPVSPATDLYAVGALFYELVSGLVPYDAPTPIQIMLAIIGSRHVPVAERVPRLSASLARFIERCLEKEPERRFASADEARRALHDARQEPSTPARPRRTVQPTTAYARAGDVHIGYQTLGSGPPDLVVVPGFVSNIEQLWEEAESRAFFTDLAEHARLVMFDKRNTGLSDRVMGAGTLDERVSDLLAVMDSAGSESAVLMGVSEGAAIALACAAIAPARVLGLVLYAGFAHHAHSQRLVEIRRMVRDAWGSGSTIDLFAPSVARDPDKRAFWARWERLGANPGAVVAHVDMLARLDVRPLLSQVRAPVLLLHRRGDRVVPAESSRRLHELLAGSVLHEYEGDDHAPMFGDTRTMLTDIAAFVARCRALNGSD